MGIDTTSGAHPGREVLISFRFRFNWKVSLFSAFFLVLFINLGFWQLRRADEKVVLLQREQLRESQPPLALSAVPADADGANGLPVRLKGHYDASRRYLLDNRVLKGTVGFEVLVPFHDDPSGQWVLVNRGFVPMGRTRSDVPEIPPLEAGTTTALGQVYSGAESQADHETPTPLPGGLSIVQQASPALVGKLTKRDFYQYLVRLRDQDPNGLPHYWPVTIMTPERHRGYAVQWFLMAIAVVGAWTAFSLRRNRSTNEVDSA